MSKTIGTRNGKTEKMIGSHVQNYVHFDPDTFKQYLSEKGMTQKQLADETGINYTTLSKMIAKGELEEVRFNFVCRILGVHKEDILKKPDMPNTSTMENVDMTSTNKLLSEILAALKTLNENIVCNYNKTNEVVDKLGYINKGLFEIVDCMTTPNKPALVEKEGA